MRIAFHLIRELLQVCEHKSSYGKNRLRLHEQSFVLLIQQVLLMTRLFLRLAKRNNQISVVIMPLLAVPSVVPGDPGELGDLGELGDPGVPGNK
jgi:hypothetical protein